VDNTRSSIGAAYIRSVDVMRFWLEHGIAINHVPEFGWPALNAITGMTYGSEGSPTKENDIKLLELLLDHGANVSLCDKQGNPPLYDACVNWHIYFVRPLLKAGADPNQQNRAGETPLHAAVFRGTTETVRLLLENGADVNIPNLHHQTPYGISEDKPEIRSLLAPHHQPRTFPVPTADHAHQDSQNSPSSSSSAPAGRGRVRSHASTSCRPRCCRPITAVDWSATTRTIRRRRTMRSRCCTSSRPSGSLGGHLTVIDATNVQPEARKPLVQLAKKYHCLPVAIVLNPPEKVCHERNRDRDDRMFGPHVVRQQRSQLRRSLKALKREGFRTSS
jgi:hypothetical protein